MTIGEHAESGRVLLFAKHAFKYYVVGARGVLVNLGILYALKEYVRLWYLVSSAIAIYISMTTNFFLNKAWTFKDTAIKHPTVFMYTKFIVISTSVC